MFVYIRELNYDNLNNIPNSVKKSEKITKYIQTQNYILYENTEDVKQNIIYEFIKNDQIIEIYNIIFLSCLVF